MRRHFALAALLAAVAGPLAAQVPDSTAKPDTSARPSQVSPAAVPQAPTLPPAPASGLYLPIASWMTPYVEHLIRAGVLQGLDPLTRPLKRADVAGAVAKVDTSDLAESVKSQLRMLAAELEERPDTVRWKLDGGVGLLGASDASRWADRPSKDSAGFFPQTDLAISVELPHVGLIAHPYVDNRLKYDPWYIGKKDRFVAGRSDENYILASWKYVDLFFGAESRNWGPPEFQGLILSDAPYAYDHLFLRIGPRRLRLEMVATQLNDLRYWDTTALAKRFLSVHRLVVEPSDRFAFSFSEAMLYAATEGVGRSFEPWYLNPLNLWLLEQYQAKPTGNSLVGADVTWQVRHDLRVAGQIYFDDFQVDRGGSGTGNNEPPAYGFTLDATGGLWRGLASWSAIYTRVMNLSYRTPANEEQYTLDGVGLARNYDDYDQWTGKLTAAALPRALLGGELTFIRQGAGDIRRRYPSVAQYADSLWFLTGVVERTLRVAAQASWSPAPGIDLGVDLGRHFVWNANHVTGARGDRWVWRVRAEIRRRVTGAIH